MACSGSSDASALSARDASVFSQADVDAGKFVRSKIYRNPRKSVQDAYSTCTREAHRARTRSSSTSHRPRRPRDPIPSTSTSFVIMSVRQRRHTRGTLNSDLDDVNVCCCCACRRCEQSVEGAPQHCGEWRRVYGKSTVILPDPTVLCRSTSIRRRVMDGSCVMRGVSAMRATSVSLSGTSVWDQRNCRVVPLDGSACTSHSHRCATNSQWIDGW